MSLSRLILGTVVMLVAGVVAVSAGWWFFVREDNQLATSAPDIPSELVEAAQTPGSSETPSSQGLTFVILADRSEAAYFADEKLASLPLPSTAKGATNDIEGAFHLTADGWALDTSQQSVIRVGLANLVSGEDRRDNRVREALEVSTYPTATFTITSVTGVDPSLPADQEQEFQMTGVLDLHGVQKEVTWDVQARREGNVLTALATTNFRYEDFNIPVLNIAGFVTVEEDVTLQMQIVAQAQ